MRKLSAHYIFPLCLPPLKNGIITLDENNTVLEIIDTNGQLRETDRLEFYSGVLVPELKDITISDLRKYQEKNADCDFKELLKHFLKNAQNGFLPGRKTSVFLISALELPDLKITEKSKLKKLV